MGAGGSVISAKDVQPWKAHPPIVVRVGGSVISAKDVQPKKAYGGRQHDLGQGLAAPEGSISISVRVGGSVTCDRPSQSPKASLASHAGP